MMASPAQTRVPLLYLLALITVTAVYYSAITSREVPLTFEQLSAMERSVLSVANTSLYAATVGDEDKVLGRLSAEDWAKAAGASVSVVALLYAPVQAVMAADTGGGGAWLTAALAAMAAPAGTAADAATAAADRDRTPHGDAPPSSAGPAADVRGLRVALFPCGCVVPAAYFATVDVRMGGRECVLLPGYVVDAARVGWAAGAAAALAPLAATCGAARAAVVGDLGGWQGWVAEARQRLPAEVVAPPVGGGGGGAGGGGRPGGGGGGGPGGQTPL